MSKNIQINKKIVAKIVKSGRIQFLWDESYDLAKVAQCLAFRGLVGEDLWTNDLLELVLAPFRDYARKQEMTENDIDKSLLSLATKIAIDVNRLRYLFYLPEFERWKIALDALPEEEKSSQKESPEKIQQTSEAEIPQEQAEGRPPEEDEEEEDEWSGWDEEE